MKIATGLGTHTMEESLIYFHSLLIASLLYACEAYEKLSEKDYRLVKSTDFFFGFRNPMPKKYTCMFPNKETYVELPPILIARRYTYADVQVLHCQV